jgi:hypothetical protein
MNADDNFSRHMSAISFGDRLRTSVVSIHASI